MKCILVFAGFLAISSQLLIAQNHHKIQQLLQQLKTAKPDTVKVRLLRELTWQYVDANEDSARAYISQMKALSDQLDYTAGKADALYYEGLTYYYHNQVDSTEILYMQALDMYAKAGREDLTDKVLQGLGLVYRTRAEHKKSLEYFQKAIAISQRYGNKLNEARTYPKVANVYLVMEQYDKAIEYYQLARRMYLEAKDTNSSIETLASIGYTYQSMKKYDTAIAIFKQALSEFQKQHYYTYVPVAFTEVGKTYLLKEQYDSALVYFRKAEECYKKNDMQSHQDAQNNYLGQTLTKLKRFSEAKPYLDKGLQMAQAEQDMEMIGEAYWGLYEFYNDQGQYKDALLNHEKFMEARDSVNRRMHFDELADMTTKYETVKKDKQIAEQNLEINRKKYWLWSSFALLLLGSLLGYSYYRRYRLKKEKQLQQEVMRQQDLATKAVLAAEEKERKRIAGELHDGVGQTMSAALMNLSAFEHNLQPVNEENKMKLEKIISLVDESCREVRSVSHNMMPNALLKSGLATAVRDFVDKIDNRVLKIDLYSEGLNEHIDSNIETVLYRVIQECVNNVIKHSGANHLDISLINDGTGISVTIEDNGRGFDTTQATRFEGIGLKNIITRVQYLKGDVEFDSNAGKGTLVAIHVPLP